MALPNSGLDLEMIRIELGLSAPTNLDACLAAAGKSRPGSISSFYGYAHVVIPTAVRNLSRTMYSSSATLSWTAPTSGADGYRISYRQQFTTTWTFSTSNTAFTNHTVNFLSSGITYEFRVEAFTSAGTGPASIVSGTTSGSGTLQPV